MIEVPAAALRARDLAGEVEFFSVGTNDLAQYTCAADRQLGGLAPLQDPWQPALLDLVAIAAEAAHEAGRQCGVCGEAAGDPALACVLTGLGVTSLSMSAPSLPRVRAELARHTFEECRRAAEAARSATTAAGARSAATLLLAPR
jgi:phosphotransferase system enzyme I (PtsI)